MIPNLSEEGSSLMRGAVPQTLVSRWLEIADSHYTRIESLVQREGIDAVQRQLPPGHRYLPHVASINLEGVYGAAETQRILECTAAISLRDGILKPRRSQLAPSNQSLTRPSGTLSPAEVERDGVRGPQRFLEIIERELGGPVVCDLDHAWVRRQYAVHRRPPGHVPHSWHQDGALLYPFDPTGACAPAADGLLRMVTCWVALTPCGQQAPGLELVRQRVDSLLPPHEMTEECVPARFPPERFWRPVMEPGDVLLFSGGTLHRTHVEPDMDADRTSIELRFFPAHSIPERLAGDRFAKCP